MDWKHTYSPQNIILYISNLHNCSPVMHNKVGCIIRDIYKCQKTVNSNSIVICNFRDSCTWKNENNRKQNIILEKNNYRKNILYFDNTCIRPSSIQPEYFQKSPSGRILSKTTTSEQRNKLKHRHVSFLHFPTELKIVYTIGFFLSVYMSVCALTPLNILRIPCN